MEGQNIQQPVVEQPVSLNTQPPVEKKGGMALFFGIIVLAAIFIIGGYLTYINFFSPKETLETQTTVTTIQVSESKDQPIKTIADQLFQSKKDLDEALSEIDGTDLDSLNEELVKNDQDASGFTN